MFKQEQKSLSAHERVSLEHDMATKLPSGNYRTQVLIDRKKRLYKSFIGATAREADMKAEQWKLAHRFSTETALSFYNAAKSFLDASSNTLAPYTIGGYRSILRTLRNEHVTFTRKNLHEIGKDDLQRLYNAMIADGKSPKTVKNCHGFVSSVFSFYDIPMPKPRLPEVRSHEINIPDEEALSRLIRAAEGTRLEVPIQLGIRGLRRGEVCAIRASDLEGNILHVQRSLTILHHKYVETIPKTKASDRYVPLPDDLANKIKEAGRATDMNPRELTHALRRFIKKEGLPHCRFHDLRHAFVSIAHANNIPDSYIMAMGGWSTGYTMNKVYRHLLDNYATEYQEKLEGILKKL